MNNSVKSNPSQQSKLFQSMLDASMNGVLLLEPVYNNGMEITDFIVRAANRSIVDHINIEARDAVDCAMSKLVPRYKELGFFDVYVSVFQSQVIQRKELRYEDNKICGWYEIAVAPTDDSIVVTFANISSYKNYQKEIETNANRLDAIINTSQSGIFLFTPVFDEKNEVNDFIFTKANPALASYVGQDAANINGSFGSTWFPAYKSNGLFEKYKETYDTGKTNHFEFHYNADSIDVWLDILATKLGDEVLVTFTDHTPTKKLQLELEESVNELKRSNADLEEFAYVASHDLQEPLRKIQYYSDRLNAVYGEQADASKLLVRMDDATKRMRTLIEDLLTYSKFSFKRQPYEVIDMNVLVREVLNDLEASVTERNASISIEPLPTLEGERLQLRQLFQNLLANALKYHNREVPLEISIKSTIVQGKDVAEHLPAYDLHKTFFQITIIDNGVGFEQTYAKRIFKIFQRLHGRSEYPGTGVGLAIVQKVVENHKGYVFAESTLGKGAAFTVLLPVE
jgi:signal transduction histidine kinase